MQMHNVVVDYGKMSAAGTSRSFRSGFIKLYGQRGPAFGAMPNYPGIAVHDTLDESKAVPSRENGNCDEVEERPTFILSNDDIYNLGHYINDVVGIWAMTVLANHGSKESLLVNIDGLRDGGPAGGGAHRLMVPSAPDTHGPYSPFYHHLWFNEVKKGVDYHSKRICYKHLYVFPNPGVPWFWNDWGRINECSMTGSSPLYQSFNVFLRQKILDKFGAQSLPNPPTDQTIHIVIEVRKINPAKHGAKTNTGRVIRNLNEFVDALSKLPNVKVTAQDFALLPFMEQIKLAHSASILISMHGAGTTHIFHAALGQKNCCGLLELFPDRTVDLYTAEGYGNLARMLGFHHYRLVGSTGSTTPTGTFVDIENAKSLVEKLIHRIQEQPTCLHNVADTRYPVYP